MKKTKPVLLIDQDDVLAEYIKALTLKFNACYGTNYQLSDCTCWDLMSIFGERILDIMHEPEIFRTLEPVQEAIETFRRLYESDLFEMYIVTAAKASVVPAKAEWIHKHLPFLPEKNMIFCMDKNRIKGDYLLDDGMHNIIAFEEAGGTPIIFNRPHNQHVISHYPRVNGWIEFEDYIMRACYPERVEEACANA